MDNFDLKKYLVENKTTFNSKLKEIETTPITLEQMHSLAINILNQLEQLQQIVEKMEEGPDNKNELVKLNTIPDNEFRKLRFISDYLKEFSRTFDGLRDYGME